MPTDRESFDVTALSDQLAADTEERLAHPMDFLVEVLRHYWMEATADEALAVWRTTVRDRPAYAVDVLNCLHQVSEQPPAGLADIVVQRGGVVRYHTDVQPYRLFDDADYAGWLGQVHDAWAEVFEARGPAGAGS